MEHGSSPTSCAGSQSACEHNAPAPKGFTAEDQAWADAYRIAYVGAANPTAAAARLAEDASLLMGKLHDTASVRNHPALQAIAGHVAFLFGQALGPADGLLQQVEENAKRLGIWV